VKRARVVEAKSSRLDTKAAARELARLVLLDLEFGDLRLVQIEEICRELAAASDSRLVRLAYGGPRPGAITLSLIVARAIRAARRAGQGTGRRRVG